MMAVEVRDVIVEDSRRIVWSAGLVFDSGDMGLKRRGFVLEWYSPRVTHFARAMITIPGLILCLAHHGPDENIQNWPAIASRS